MNRLENEQVEHLRGQEQFERLVNEAKLRRVEGLVSDKAYPDDIRLVDVSRLPETPEIQGPQDFKGNTPAERQAHYESLKREMLMHEEMRPYIEQEYGPEMWDAWDQQAELGHASSHGYERGYVDVYKAYCDKSNAIAVGGEVNGQYTEILNGRHRVFLARELGIRKLPVYIEGRQR